MLFRIYLSLFVFHYLSVNASDCEEKPHCGVNEVWDCLCLPRFTCDDPCGRRDGPHVCPLGPDGNCVKECICKPGFVRGSNGLCTHCTQCTQLDEDDCCDDEEYQECGTFCPETCASRGEIDICTLQCVQGCFCKEGRVRDINGTCVHPKECPGKGGDGGDGSNKGGDKGCKKGCGGDPNAHPGCGMNCGKTCATYKNPPKVCPLGCIQHGCDCNDGYVKDPNVGKCVRPKDCTPTCKTNEVYKKCGPACPATCNNGGDTTGCPEEPCVAGCFCKDGYVRANSGKCVKLNDCNKCVTNETYTDCGSLCPWDCSNYGDPIGCGAECIKGCFCTKGYYRNSNGDCVLLKDCPPKKCGENEYFSQCGPDCEPYCKDISDEIVCDGQCKYGCFCKEGYFRHNGNNKCVKIEDCNSACPKGEVFKTCGTSCQPTCNDPDPPCNKKCSRSCFCPDGYIREQTGGRCIKIDDCPPGCKGDPNARLSSCGDVCPATCANGGVRPEICILICKINSCVCLPGFVLDDNGKCITLDECPLKGCGGDPNAHPGCGMNCGRHCSDYKNPPHDCDKRIGCIQHGCDCNDGYVKDANIGKCVKPEDCTPTCKENEEYDSCGSACPPSCNTRGLNESCTDQCVPGCFCKKGWVRANNGRCVKLEDCDDCGENETYITCGSLCAEDCATYGDGLACGALCVKGCFCTKGYYRNSDGYCVLLNDCQPKKCRKNEYFNKCGPDCEEYCTDLTGIVVCDEDKCKYGCFCKKGFYRNNLGECVTIKECVSVCPKGEIYNPCGKARQATCDDRDPECGGKCVRNCYCPKGFIRKQQGGPCIKIEDCPPPSCNGDPNAHPGCGLNCGRTCADYKDPPCDCDKRIGCILHGCDCNDGYVKDNNLNKCVKPDDCTPICGINETFSQNPLTCPPQTCDAIGKAFSCLANTTNPPACICKEGYLRNKENECVLKADCDTCGDDPNARPGCGNPCGRTCADIGQPPHACPAFCTDGCDCIEGYWLDTNTHKCVLPEDCPPQCGPGEDLVTCPVDCPDDFCPKKDGPPHVCPTPKHCNKPKCKCRFNFRRAKNGTCIPTRDCPPFKCHGRNEVFDACPPICPGESCADAKLNGVCPFKIGIILICNPRCRCAEGFFRDENNVCIPESCCPDS